MECERGRVSAKVSAAFYPPVGIRRSQMSPGCPPGASPIEWVSPGYVSAAPSPNFAFPAGRPTYKHVVGYPPGVSLTYIYIYIYIYGISVCFWMGAYAGGIPRIYIYIYRYKHMAFRDLLLTTCWLHPYQTFRKGLCTWPYAYIWPPTNTGPRCRLYSCTCVLLVMPCPCAALCRISM
jgi:hypothetical protein